MSEKKTYLVSKATSTPKLCGDWNDEVWSGVIPANVDTFHKESSSHHPNVQAKMVYDEKGIYVHFRVMDQFVIAKYVGQQQMVCRDSCAEFFVEPISGKGYFNIEMSCGGSILMYYVTVPRKEEVPVSETHLNKISIYHSMPTEMKQEISDPTTWQLEYFVPYEVFEAYIGNLDEQKPEVGKGVKWRGNFYKCADESSHPHWGMWNDVGEKLDFHQPNKFGDIVFE